jgi:serine/threonine-protein kinase
MRRNLGPYELVRVLGRGGMAEVYLARGYGASGFSREVAIKTLAPELVGHADLERALIREATLAGKLRHRNLVAVLGLGVDDGLYYVVLEYVDGGDLADIVLPEPLALHVISELALGLEYLHDSIATSVRATCSCRGPVTSSSPISASPRRPRSRI